MDKSFISKFLKGSFSTSIGQASTIGFHFFSIMLLARHMPKEVFGLYSIIVVICHGCQILAGMGMNLTLVKHISGEAEEKPAEVFVSILLVRMVMLALVSLLVLSLGNRMLPQWFGEEIGNYVWYIPVIFALGSIRELLFHLLQGLRLFKKYAQIQVYSAAIRLITIVFLVKNNLLAVEYLLMVEIITYGLSILLQLYMAPMRTMLTSVLNRQTLNRIVTFGFPLYLNDMLTYVYNKSSVLLIAALMTSSSVAIYEIASKVPDAFFRLFTSLIVVFFPSIAELLKSGQKEMAVKFLDKSLVICAAVLSFIALVAFLFKEEIVILIFSDQYREASLVFSIMMMNLCLNSLSRLIGYSILAAGFSTVPVKITSVTSIINLGTCLLLIPPYGVLGAAYTLLIMNIVSLFLHLFYSKKADLNPNLFAALKPVFMMGIIVVASLFVPSILISLKIIIIVIFALSIWILVPETRSVGNYLYSKLSSFKWKPL